MTWLDDLEHTLAHKSPAHGHHWLFHNLTPDALEKAVRGELGKITEPYGRNFQCCLFRPADKNSTSPHIVAIMVDDNTILRDADHFYKTLPPVLKDEDGQDMLFYHKPVEFRIYNRVNLDAEITQMRGGRGKEGAGSLDDTTIQTLAFGRYLAGNKREAMVLNENAKEIMAIEKNAVTPQQALMQFVTLESAWNQSAHTPQDAETYLTGLISLVSKRFPISKPPAAENLLENLSKRLKSIRKNEDALLESDIRDIDEFADIAREIVSKETQNLGR